MITIQNLHFAYRKKTVFSGLNLELQAGRIYGLLGKNGTGKSTLLRNIAGLLFPDKGNIQVLEFRPGRRQPAFLQQVFLVPEEFYLPNVSIKNFVRTNALFYPAFNRRHLENYLGQFEIHPNTHLQEMSYGQKKKFLISFGLACNTKLLLMDEPTNGLDIISKTQFRKVMAGVVNEDKCIIISTHQVKDLERLIDRITIIDDGRIIFDHTIEDVAKKLLFKISFDSNEVKHSFYVEDSFKGSAIVTANTEGGESKLDLEMLYKAIILNRGPIQNLFNQK